MPLNFSCTLNKKGSMPAELNMWTFSHMFRLVRREFCLGLFFWGWGWTGLHEGRDRKGN